MRRSWQAGSPETARRLRAALKLSEEEWPVVATAAITGGHYGRPLRAAITGGHYPAEEEFLRREALSTPPVCFGEKRIQDKGEDGRKKRDK